MRECWVNVYKYPKLNKYCYSHQCKTKGFAKLIGSKAYNRGLVEGNAKKARKTLYRLHVKLKDQPGLSRYYPYQWDKRKQLILMAGDLMQRIQIEDRRYEVKKYERGSKD